ncbi:hypothetical protein K353_03461 [Kitasatospora sp. SolWspMP-SS2h]|uniref:hypothetical protein n=1 Tax=Kitasatospora sp. SolWspMP-SS2h TaxID=1305729 RepID=UPI000DB9BA24|nr:hypothetical protein [Kitasatospora sp. SolWspMP-SS2h]RAJ39973.1 hypothetical protein K353_03461 [Kitasatospora sp. SolWspMP-SS2h]
MIEITEDRYDGWRIRLVFSQDDPEGWISKARDVGYLENMLAALGDPMDASGPRARGAEAELQLEAVSWFVAQLSRRQDALLAALGDSGVSRGEPAGPVDLHADDPALGRGVPAARHGAAAGDAAQG